MRSNLIGFAAVSALTSLLVGCGPFGPFASGYQFGQSDNGTTQTVKNPSNVTISIPGNATTGYSWQLASISNPAVVTSVSTLYKPNAAPAGMAGTPGTWVFQFQVIGAGTSTIILQQFPPGVSTPSDTYTLTLVAQ